MDLVWQSHLTYLELEEKTASVLELPQGRGLSLLKGTYLAQTGTTMYCRGPGVGVEKATAAGVHRWYAVYSIYLHVL